MDKKAFFFDFDGTIWFGHFGEKTLKALKDLHEKGHLLFYNSGRSKANTHFDKIQDVPFDYFLFGGCHAETSSGEVLYCSNITKEAMQDTVEIENQYDLLIIYEGTKNVYKRKGILTWIPCEELEDNTVLVDANAHPISKFSIFKRKNEQGGYDPICSQALECLAKHYILIEMGSYVECIQKGHGKDVIIKIATNILGIDLKDTYAFGDSMNDFPMFETCAKKVAIGHSPNELKALATYVTKEEENGVWEALNAFGFVD